MLALMLLPYGQSLWADTPTDRFTEGAQYQRIDPPWPLTGHTDRIEVVEMFLYACPHCYEMEPAMRKWLEDKPDVEFLRVPAIAGPSWADQARAFYMIEQLKGREQMHQALFKAIHEHGKEVYNEYAVVDFLVSQGVDRDKAIALYRSPETAAGVNKARIDTVKYGLRGVPAVIVNGEFKTAPFFVHNQAEMFEVLDSLLEKERKKLAADKRAGK
ncbi:MAG: thiol:disulfide interchange protein DsbA/DsbL [Gammaproteobacteria bacterium]|jgi:thiol:disulfide interchange protein DsbA